MSDAADDDGLTKREMLSMAKDLQNGQVSEDQITNVWDSIDPATKRRALANALNELVAPHFVGVKERAADDADPEAVREAFADKSMEEKEEYFNRAIGELVATLFEVRENPDEGLLRLKGLLRDPYTMEALLLFFDKPSKIDPDYSEEMKEFGAQYVQAAGVAIAPEMYDEETVREVYQMFGLDPEADRGGDLPADD